MILWPFIGHSIAGRHTFKSNNVKILPLRTFKALLLKWAHRAAASRTLNASSIQIVIIFRTNNAGFL